MPTLQNTLSCDDILRHLRERFYTRLLALALALQVLLALTAIAHAAAAAATPAATSYPISIQSALSGSTEFIFALLSALVTWAVTYATAKFKLNQATSALASTTIASGLALAHAKALQAEQNIKDPNVKSQMVAQAVQFFIDETPVALSALGLSQQKLIALATAHLPSVQAGVDAASASSDTAATAASSSGATSTAAGTTGTGTNTSAGA